MMSVAFERQYADNLAVASLPNNELRMWEECRSAHRFMAFKGKQLIVYRLFLNRPELIKVMTCIKVELDFDSGFTSTWSDGVRHIAIGQCPTLIGESIFLWHVFDSQVQYIPYNGKYGIRLPLAYRSQLNPNTMQEGCEYILERNVYESTFGNN